jgi:ABC-2 type transport system permease protein
MKKYLRLYYVFLRANMIKLFMYRGDFWLGFLLTGAQSVAVLLGLNIMFLHINNIAGWSYNDMLVLLGTFMLTDALSWMLFRAGVNNLDSIINNGDLDWYLIKPIDTQFMVTVQKLDAQDAGRSFIGIPILIYGLQGTSLFTNLLNIPLFIVTLLLGQVVLYSITLAVKTISFKSIQGWATSAISWRFYDLARYPVDIYSGAMRIIYTFVLPLVFIATVPAKVFTGEFRLYMLLGAIVAASVSLFLVRLIWNKALRGYSSASS